LGHVINYDLPDIPETYVHRIGRTGRAGAGGIAISFCDYEERTCLADIQRLISKQIPIVKNHPYEEVAMPPYTGKAAKQTSLPNRPKHQGTSTIHGRLMASNGTKNHSYRKGIINK